jgi:hypothetical protein
MVKTDVWFLIDSNLLKRVRTKLRELYKELLRAKLNDSDLLHLKKFRKYHDFDDSEVNDFFKYYIQTNLISKSKHPDKDKLLIFGYLRTLFLGILRSSPRTNVLSKRVKKYERTYELSKALESFLSLYRKKIGFTKRELSQDVLKEAGKTISKCKNLPQQACLPPRCQYVQKTMKNGMIRGYCAKKYTRRKSRRISKKDKSL